MIPRLFCGKQPEPPGKNNVLTPLPEEGGREPNPLPLRAPVLKVRVVPDHELQHSGAAFAHMSSKITDDLKPQLRPRREDRSCARLPPEIRRRQPAQKHDLGLAQTSRDEGRVGVTHGSDRRHHTRARLLTAAGQGEKDYRGPRRNGSHQRRLQQCAIVRRLDGTAVPNTNLVLAPDASTLDIIVDEHIAPRDPHDSRTKGEPRVMRSLCGSPRVWAERCRAGEDLSTGAGYAGHGGSFFADHGPRTTGHGPRATSAQRCGRRETRASSA